MFLCRGERFSFVHDLGELLRQLERNGLKIPKYVWEADELTSFASVSRDPAPIAPVTERRYRRAVRIAVAVLRWAERKVGSKLSWLRKRQGLKQSPMGAAAMFPAYSTSRSPGRTAAPIADLLRGVSSKKLSAFVDMLAFPRHYVAERRANVRARDLLLKLLRGFGYTPQLQGSYDNIVAAASDEAAGPCLLVGAHYDSVPGTPGADDNASAVAVCLECARLLKQHDIGSTTIVFFNREEDGLLGSSEFVAELAAQAAHSIEEAHIFEMVGFRNRTPGSQRMPPGLPGFLAPKVGDFLALLANRHSNVIAENLLSLAASYLPQFPVVALKMYFGIERFFGHLHRSDHAPFWKAGIPALMWTDTSEFRNPHYHQSTDTPDTLDYEFIAEVTKLALARAVSRVWK